MAKHFPQPAEAFTIAALLILSAGCTHSTAVAPTDPTASRRAVVERVEVDPLYDSIFVPEERGFLGADGAASVDLGDGRILWVFGDTILGRTVGGERKGSMIRNSIAIQDTREGLPGSVTYHWDLTDNLPGDFFRPDEWDDPAWYWPGTGVFHDGKVYLFLSEMREGEGPAGFSFQTVGTDLFVVENPGASPQEWEVSRTDFVEASDHFNVNAASLVHGEYIWFLGYVDPEDDGSRRRMFTARLSLADLESESPGDRLQFWTNADQWSASPEDLKHQFAPGVTETALHYDSKRNRFLAVGLEPFQEEILLYQAPSPAGPWEQPVHVYDVPELSESDVFVAYAARLHPMLAEGEDDLPMTYVVNTTDFWSMFSEMHIYYPRFIRIHLDE